MFLKKIDVFSPLITLNYKGKLRHTSIFGGLSAVLLFVSTLGMVLYYSLIFLMHKNPSAFFCNRFIDDAGEFPVNSSSMFSFIQLYNSNNTEKLIDFDALTIIGINSTINNYKNKNNLTEYNHWIYGKCNIDSDIEGINELIIKENFTRYPCIKKFYKKNESRYYDTNDPNFEWPIIKHGQSRRDATFYGIIVEKCRNDTLKRMRDERDCKSNDEIDEYMTNVFFNYQMLDQYTDVLNYSKPITKYFYSITDGKYTDTFSINHLNFNPLIVKSHNGIFIDNIVEQKSYVFEQNEKVLEPKETSGIYIAFFYWMQNRLQYYERNYKMLQDVLASIGGMFNLILIVLTLINYLVSDYIILLDTEELINKISSKNLDKLKKTESKINKIPSINGHGKKITDSKKGEEEYYKNNRIKKLKNDIQKGIIMKKTESINSKNEKTNLSGKVIVKNKFEIKNNYFKEIEEGSKDKIITMGESLPKERRKEKTININDIIKKRKFNFCKYLSFLFSCYKNNPRMKYFYDLRNNIISEENIIQNNLNIFNLFKFKKYVKQHIQKFHK